MIFAQLVGYHCHFIYQEEPSCPLLVGTITILYLCKNKNPKSKTHYCDCNCDLLLEVHDKHKFSVMVVVVPGVAFNLVEVCNINSSSCC